MMDEGSNVPKSPCQYCRVVKAHLQCCPHDNPLAQMIWSHGYQAATKGESNTHADDPTYTLGYTSGEIARRKNPAPATDEPIVFGPQRYALDEDGAPSPRGSFPGTAELALALHDRRHEAPHVPPGKAFEDAVVARAESVIY